MDAITGSRCPAAFLFYNGNAAFFDPHDQQIGELQAYGWCGVHEFIERYPNAPIYFQGREDPIPMDIVPWITRNIRKRPGARPVPQRSV